jgi:hypothetical protein
MTLYTNSSLGVNWRWALDDLLMTDVATWLRWFDIPVPGTQLEHLGVMARSFIGALVNQQPRPRGLVPQLADTFGTSRQTIYTIGERIDEGVFVRPNGRRPAGVNSPEALVSPSYPVVPVTPNRVRRTVLTNLLPGGMTIRPQIESLQTALDSHRCEGWISELILEAGERAGRKLDEMDLSALGQVVTARDELYFDDKVFLINVEPRHFVIVGAYVEEQCDSKTWGVALQLDHHTRGLQIIGLAEDGATMYPASIREAELSLQVQKDVWHIESKAGQAVTDLERMALKALEHADDLLCQINKDGAQDDDARLAKWIQADDRAENLVNLSAQVRCLRGHVCDALELVDWRSGEIREHQVNEWLLTEVIKELGKLDHPRVRKLVKYLKDQQDEMLTFLGLLEVQLAPWQRQLAQHIPDETQCRFFQATVARAWRLNRAVVNGHTSFRPLAEFATDLMTELVADDPVAIKLAEALFNVLESVVRTSCAAETINSILRPYLTVKRSFQSRKTAQAWLNLFCLWFNMHPLKRSKRRHSDQPMSPYQYAGIKVYTDDGRETLDWLEAIGYPPDDR